MPYIPTDYRDGPKSGCVQAQFTRPANTTQYAAGDVVGTSPAANLAFANVARVNGGGLRIVGATLHKTDNDTTGADFDLVVFDAAPTAIADNAEWLPSDAEGATVVAVVSFANGNAKVLGAASATGNLWQTILTHPVPVACAPTSRALYGVLVARGTYTPASAEVFSVTLHVEID